MSKEKKGADIAFEMICDPETITITREDYRRLISDSEQLALIRGLHNTLGEDYYRMDSFLDSLFGKSAWRLARERREAEQKGTLVVADIFNPQGEKGSPEGTDA